MSRSVRIVLAVAMGLVTAGMLVASGFIVVHGPALAAIPTLLLAAAFGYFLYHDVKILTSK